jgi:hypothetical protein
VRVFGRAPHPNLRVDYYQRLTRIVDERSIDPVTEGLGCSEAPFYAMLAFTMAVTVPRAASHCFPANTARYGGFFLNQPFFFLREMSLDENSSVIIMSQEM